MDGITELSMRNCLILFLLLISPEVFAVYLTPIPTDKSMEYLGMIFGSTVGNITFGTTPIPNPVLPAMFKIFNIVVLVFGVLIISFTGFMSTLQYAQEGTSMNKRWGSIWLPVRTAIAMGLVVPTPVSGYAAIQVMVMWVIVQGIGAANIVWNIVLDNLSAGVALGALEVDSDRATDQGTGLASQLLDMAVCAESVRALAGAAPFPLPTDWPSSGSSEMVSSHARSLDVYPDGYRESNNGDSAAVSGNFIVGVPGHENYSKFCGSLLLTSVVEREEWPETLQSSADPIGKAIELFNIRYDAVSAAYAELLPIAQQIVQLSVLHRNYAGRLDPNRKPVPSGFMDAARDAYASGMSFFIIPMPPDGPMQEAILSGRRNGWITAGSYYFDLTNMMNQQLFRTANIHPPEPGRLGNSASNIPTFIRLDTHEVLDYLNEEEKIFVLNRLEDANTYKGIDATMSLESIGLKGHIGKDGHALVEPLQNANASAVRWWQGLLHDHDGSDPLIGIAIFGSKIMVAAEMAVLGAAGLAVIATVIAAVAGICAVQFPPFLIFFSTMATILPIVILLLSLLWAVGAGMAVYMPMIPYLMFFVAALGWMVLVIEALVSAPIFALSLASPTGDKIGQMTSGMMLLTNIFIRPSLMILGFLLAARLLRVAIDFIDFTFADVLNTINISGSLLSPIVAIMVYEGFVIALVNKCFSLIYHVPDRILAWVGGPVFQTREYAQAVQEAKKTFDAGAEQIGQVQLAVGNTAAEKFKQSIDDVAKKAVGGGGDDDDDDDDDEPTKP